MNNYKTLDEINKEIEEELLNLKENDYHNNKKQFLSFKFLGVLLILISMLLGIFKLFI